MTSDRYPFPVHALRLAARMPVVEPAENFWAAARLTLKDQDLPFLAGESSPGVRVWLLLHGQGGAGAGAMGGLALAHALAAQGRCTVLLDAQENDHSLTRQCGRLFRSGWLDMARYGTSLASAALTVDWEGRQGYFLGLGSYCPTEMSSAEIQVLMSRVQGQVDDVIVVCGAGPEAVPWAEIAKSYLYCWDAARESLSSRDAALHGFEDLGIPCEGVLALDIVEDTPKVAGDQLDEIQGAGSPSCPPPAEPAEVPVETHSSGVFRWVALLGLLGVSVLALFIWKFTEFGTIQISPEPSYVGGEQETPEFAQLDSQFVVPSPRDSSSSWVTEPDSQVVARDSVPVTTGVVAMKDSIAQVELDPELVVEAEPDPSSAWQEVAPAFATPVGEQGWCLHVYSLRDSSAARREIQLVERRGLQAVMAPAVLPDSTLWFRVYVGDFASRAAAAKAEPALKWKLRTDWARPTVLKGSARN